MLDAAFEEKLCRILAAVNKAHEKLINKAFP